MSLVDQAPLPARARRTAAVVAAVALAALFLQYALLFSAAGDAVGMLAATVRFFSYFTVLSNCLVALATAQAARGQAGSFVGPGVRGAVALYVAATCLVYVGVLRHLWQPQGLQWWADVGLHYATPALYLAWWLFAAPHGGLKFRHLAIWLVFPAVFLGWTFLRGVALGEYPYPFLDVGVHGWHGVGANAAGIAGLLLVLGAALVAIDRALARAGR